MSAANTRFSYATRLNGFKAGGPAVWQGRNRVTSLDLIERAATVLSAPAPSVGNCIGQLDQVIR